MKQYKIFALASIENEGKIENILDTQKFQCIESLLLDKKIVVKIMNNAVDALVIMADKLTKEDCLLLEEVYMARKNLVMVLITQVCDIDTLTEAMSCGIRKVLTSDMEENEISDSIIAEIKKSRNRGNDSKQKQHDSKILSIFGTKGGAGKTTVAVNLAVTLQKKGKKVLLFDLDLQFGDVGVFMDAPSIDTISDLVSEGEFDLSTIESYLFTHSCGVQLLLAPQSPEFAELVKPEHINKIVDEVKGSFDYIIFDLGPTLDECVLQALEVCNTIYFIVTPEISTLKNTKTCMNVLSTLELAQKVKFVLNKDGDSYVKKKDMEAALDDEIVLVIPSEPKNTIASINRGVPIVIANPRSKASKEIIRYVNSDSI